MPSNPAVIAHLKTRRSVAQAFLGAPGPDAAELEQVIELGTRVPDHGKLAPWRLVVFEGEARERAGQLLADLAKTRQPEIDEAGLEKERNQLLPAPVVIGVLSSPKDNPKIPESEQVLSAANVAFALEHAAFALGFAANWTTRWFAYDDEAARLLGAREGERFVAFVHIGTPKVLPEERPRPRLSEIVTRWQGP